MRTFGGFLSRGALLYGELRDEAVHVLTKPYWLGLEFSGAVIPLSEVANRFAGRAGQAHRGRPQLRRSY